MPQPTWDDIRRFCKVEGWRPTHEGRGSRRRDHDRFTLALPDGRVLRTRASHGRAEIGDPALVAHILRAQLEVTEAEFWDAVRNGTPPPRAARDRGPQPSTSPAPTESPQVEPWLAVFLAFNLGIDDEEIASMLPEDAMQRYLAWCASLGR